MKEILKILMLQNNDNQATLAKRSGVTQPTIQRFLAGTHKNPNSLTAVKLASAYNLSESQFRGDMPINNIGELKSNLDAVPQVYRKVPLISWPEVAKWAGIINTIKKGDVDKWMSCPVPHSNNTFVIKIAGDSMYNPHGRQSFREGDLIFIDPDRQYQSGSLVVGLINNQKHATFKKLVIESGNMYFRALNPAWPEQIIKINTDATICGVVIFKGEII